MIIKALVILGVLIVVAVIVTLALAAYSLNKHYREEDDDDM